MNPVQERIKECTDSVLSQLKQYDFRRKQSPDKSSGPPPLRQRAKWNKSSFHSDPFSCSNCENFRNIIENLQGQIQKMKEQLLINKNEISILKENLSKSEEIRRNLNQIIQVKKGPIRVCCRVKPALASFIEYPSKGLEEKSQMIQISKNSLKNVYLFDRIFDEQSTQVDVFDEAQTYIQTAIDGGKVCIFSYGQTGSGKTFTLEGQTLTDKITEKSGILPRSAHLLFEEIDRQSFKSSQINISCAEVYMDQITDLLSESRKVIKSLDSVIWYPVNSLFELLSVICESSKRRVTRDTHLNSTSSRSHTIYQIRIDGEVEGKFRSGRLSIIDLAGSERASTESFSSKSTEEVESMKKVLEEGKFINKSLSCLKRVFMALASKSTTLVPYRDSKLTKVLQDQLQAGLVIVFVTVSPDNYQESLESLKFGSNIQDARI
jgi:hypothetical protein